MVKDMKEIKKIYLRRGNCKTHRFLADDEGSVIVSNLTDKQVQFIKEYLERS